MQVDSCIASQLRLSAILINCNLSTFYDMVARQRKHSIASIRNRLGEALDQPKCGVLLCCPIEGAELRLRWKRYIDMVGMLMVWI